MDEKIFQLLINALVLLTALPVHESAHAWAAHKMGDDTAKNQGRITLNPIKHLSLWGSIMMIAIGFGWGKPVDVNPNNFTNRKKGMVLTSLAGPASNFLMAFVAMIVFRVLNVTSYIHYENEYLPLFAQVFMYITLINISLGVFNFLPIPPLDGSKIFNAILPEKVYFSIMRYEQFIFIALIVLMYSGVLDKPLSFLQNGAVNIMIFLTDWVDRLMEAILAI